MKVSLLTLLVLLTTTPLAGQNDVQRKVRAYRQANEHRIFNAFVDLLSIPNVASDQHNIRKNAALIMELMRSRQLNPRLLEAKTPNVSPAIYGEWSTPGAKQTIILYAHYDGQPTDAKQWSGTEPWHPLLRTTSLDRGGQTIPMPAPSTAINPDWRLYARSAADDKAGVMAIFTAFDAVRSGKEKLTSNLKFFFEGEEEAGSPHLAEIIQLNQPLLRADAWIICDGPIHQSGRKQVVFGVRGDTNVDLTVYASSRPLHSGHYGNWAPNPAQHLAQLLASMKDRSGRVIIAGWNDDVEILGEAERLAIAEAPKYDDELRLQLGLAKTDGEGKTLLELINLPSLNINGMSSGDIGSLARNVIPTSATAVLDLRLVKGNDYKRQVQRLVTHIREQGFYIVETEPTSNERLKHSLIAKVIHRSGGYNAERTRMDLRISLAVIAAVQSTSVDRIVRLPTAGGSLPLSIITENLKTVTITVPIANYDNNQHAENENIRLQNLWDGIETYATIMTMKH